MAPGKPATLSPLQTHDFDEWARLFKGFMAHCLKELPAQQYRSTFNRLIDPTNELRGLVLRDPEDETRLVAIAHFLPHASTTTEKTVMALHDLFVDPAARREGYGRQLLFAVVEESKALGCLGLHWSAYHSNAEARRLYDEVATCDFVEYRIKIDG